jgi:hypothetical protein
VDVYLRKVQHRQIGFQPDMVQRGVVNLDTRFCTRMIISGRVLSEIAILRQLTRKTFGKLAIPGTLQFDLYSVAS